MLHTLRIGNCPVLPLLGLMAASLAGAFETVVIDAGHGGNDEGTAWYHVKEKDVALAVALRLEQVLSKQGVKCELTRKTDIYLSLDERADFANHQSNALLVSIHFNGSQAIDSSGFSAYYFSQSLAGKFAARTIQDALDDSHLGRNRGIAANNYALLVRAQCCGVLVECGFLSNKAEAMRLASPVGQQALADALALGILRAKSVDLTEPPETAIAKCEAIANREEQKERTRRASSASGKQPVNSPLLLQKK